MSPREKEVFDYLNNPNPASPDKIERSQENSNAGKLMFNVLNYLRSDE